MAKKPKVEPKRITTRTRTRASRWQRERRVVRTTWVLILLAIFAALGIAGLGYYENHIAVWHKPAIRVNDTVLDMSYYVKMLRLAVRGQQGAAPVAVAQTVRDSLENAELIRQKAPGLGIQVAPDEITEAVRLSILPPDAESQGGVDSTEPYQQRLDEFKLSDEDYRRVVENDLLREKLRGYLEQQVPETAEQIHLHVILLDSDQQAGEVRAKLTSGEDFAALAQGFSLDEESKENGGDLGWVPRGIYHELDEAAFSLEPGTVSEPLPTTQGYYLIKVSERAETRSLDDTRRGQLKANALFNWLLAQRETNLVEDYLDMDKIAWAIDQIK